MPPGSIAFDPDWAPWEASKLEASARQRDHYEQIHDIYERHYYDDTSMLYREEFIFRLLCRDLDLNGKRVAELASGSGHNSLSLMARYPDIDLIGFDISPSACNEYRRSTGFPCHELDLTKPAEISEQVDMAFIIGGLHHCVADLPQTLANAAKLVKPGGMFIMQEPNSQFFLEAVRKAWYRVDASFDAETEHALNHDELMQMGGGKFECRDLTYFGGPGYFGILNSMILRIPLAVKPVLAPPLMIAERIWNRLPGRAMHNVFLARWDRTDAPAGA